MFILRVLEGGGWWGVQVEGSCWFREDSRLGSALPLLGPGWRKELSSEGREAAQAAVELER